MAAVALRALQAFSTLAHMLLTIAAFASTAGSPSLLGSFRQGCSTSGCSDTCISRRMCRWTSRCERPAACQHVHQHTCVCEHMACSQAHDGTAHKLGAATHANAGSTSLRTCGSGTLSSSGRPWRTTASKCSTSAEQRVNLLSSGVRRPQRDSVTRWRPSPEQCLRSSPPPLGAHAWRASLFLLHNS